MANWFNKSQEGEQSQETPSPESSELVVTNSQSEESNTFSLLSQAQNAIAQAQSLDEIKDIRDKAEAARKYAQAAGMGLEIQNYAAEVKLRAERRAGGLLAKLKLHGGDRSEKTADDRLTLGDIGITKDQSSRWQLTAIVSEKEFDRYLERIGEERGEVTTAGLVRIARVRRAKQNKRKKNVTAPLVTDCLVTSNLEQLLSAGEKFGCLYANPPWPGSDENKALLAALSKMPIEMLMGMDAHLHLWATNDSLFYAKRALENWGFELKSCLLCLNSAGRPGDYWAEAHEYLLLGVRGNLALQEHGLKSWMRSGRDSVGTATDRVRKLIERVSPGPYLELFGRREASNWTIYNTSIESTVDSKPTEEGEGNAETAGT